MKKLLTTLVAIVAVFTCFMFTACVDKEPLKVDENTVVITATDDSFDFANKTLKQFMDHLQESGKFTYSIKDGMITSINGKSNTANSYWMLYTGDAENANQEWGTFEYEGTIYGSATLGANELIVKEDCIYIWAYQTFA